MFTFSKLATLVFVAGLVFSVTEAAPMSPVMESSLYIRSPKTPPCVAKHKSAKKIKRDIELNELYPRTRTHKSPTGSMTLWHGTTNPNDFASFTMEGRRKSSGDFHFNKAAFYMTDYEGNAIEYPCKFECLGADAKVTVIEFHWAGSPNVHMFNGLDDPVWALYQKWTADGSEGNHTPHEDFDKIHNMDMIAGPMQSEGDKDSGMHEDFWQYVLTNADAAGKLTMGEKKEVKCGDHASKYAS